MENKAAIQRAEKKMDNSTMFIMRNECFLTNVLMQLDRQMIGDGTMATNGLRLWWSWRFVDGECTSDKVSFIMIHELLHVVLKHHLRLGDKDARIWNNACDYMINLLITRMGLTKAWTDEEIRRISRGYLTQMTVKHPAYAMPEDGMMDPKYAGMTADEIYVDLIKGDKGEDDKPNQPGDEGQPGEEGKGSGPTSKGDCPWGGIDPATNDDGSTMDVEEAKAAEKMLDQQLALAADIAKGRGQMSGVLGDMIKANKKASQDWKDVLPQKIDAVVQSDYTFSKQNRRRLNSRLIMPAMDEEGIGHVCIMTDASGSMSSAEFDQAMSDTMHILEAFTPTAVTLIQFDWDACEPEELDQGDEPEMIRRKTGGTRFSAPFVKADKLGILEDFDLIVVFTDGGDNQYPTGSAIPECPTIWASTGAFYDGPPPFGECIQVKFR